MTNLPVWLQPLGKRAAGSAPARPADLHGRSTRVLIIFFCFFYTSIVFNPDETADNLRKYGGFLPGIRPGKRTAEYLDYVLTRLTVIGAAYITAVCLLPEVLIANSASGHLFRRHLDPDRGDGDHGHGGPNPVTPARPPV